MSTDDFLQWKFDVSTIRLIGRQLITDRITAIFELVKNSYDANATKVDVILNNVSKLSSVSEIIISDNGHGMSLVDLEDKWMVVGTSSKRKQHYSPKPFERRYIGEKGIGRFAVDRLGDAFEIKTTQSGDSEQINIKIDWRNYHELEVGENLNLFTDVHNSFDRVSCKKNSQGTKLIIRCLEEPWSETDLHRLELELEKIVSPFQKLNLPFDIYLTANDNPTYSKKKIKSDKIQFSSLNFHLKSTKEKQEVLIFNKKKGTITTAKIDVHSFGPIEFKLYYFDEAGKHKFRKAYKKMERKIDGVKIYRDGLITTPFAEFESSPDKKRDILGIDKRLWSGTFNKIGSREIIGILDINKDNNPKIIDATNRQDFLDNKEYRDLKEFIIEQLNVLTEYKKYAREKKTQENQLALEEASTEIDNLKGALSTIEAKHPDLKPELSKIKREINKTKKTIDRGVRDQREEKADFIRKENMYLSLMSLQEYAAHISHAVRTSIFKAKGRAAFFKRHYPNPKFNNYYVKYAQQIDDQLTNLVRVIDFMLSYASSEAESEDLNLKGVLNNIFTDSEDVLFKPNNIIAELEIADNCKIQSNKIFFQDIFNNLISNSIKAISKNKIKKIKCVSWIEGNNIVILFSDNGCGIKKGKEIKIFDIFITTTADQGGAGIGLYIVKTRVESLNGTIEVVDSEFTPTGTTFKIVLPFKES